MKYIPVVGPVSKTDAEPLTTLHSKSADVSFLHPHAFLLSKLQLISLETGGADVVVEVGNISDNSSITSGGVIPQAKLLNDMSSSARKPPNPWPLVPTIIILKSHHN